MNGSLWSIKEKQQFSSFLNFLKTFFDHQCSNTKTYKVLHTLHERKKYDQQNLAIKNHVRVFVRVWEYAKGRYYFLHSVIPLTECIGIVRVWKYRVICLSVCVCLWVCVSVCVSALVWRNYWAESMKLSKNSSLYI